MFNLPPKPLIKETYGPTGQGWCLGLVTQGGDQFALAWEPGPVPNFVVIIRTMEAEWGKLKAWTFWEWDDSGWKLAAKYGV